MTAREVLIRKIKVGDIFHATCPNGASLVCLATKVDDSTVHARRLFMEDTFDFDRTTGMADSEGIPCMIDSVAPLPIDIRDIFFELDHRYRTSTDPEAAKLTADEIRALKFIADHYPANRI